MRTLSSFRDAHRGESVVVCGCGESLNTLAAPERFVTVGVNDVGRRFQPRYLVVVNPRNQFTGDRFAFVERSQAEYVFTQLDLGLARGGVVRFRLGTYGGTGAGSGSANPEALDYTQNSPYVALCLAAHMGARRVGLIGVDFTDHHFFARTGRHSLAPQLDSIDAQYRRLGDALRARGVEVFNLSAASRLTAFPKISVEEFAALAAADREGRAGAEALHGAGTIHGAEAGDGGALDAGGGPLNVVSYATTPVAGVPAILARCVSARTPHAARCVWARRDYGNGVSFEGDIEWADAPARAEEELRRADVVVVHNGKVEPRHRSLLAGKALVTMAHNYMWNVEQALVREGFPGVVVGQYQAALAEFEGWAAVPNPVPLWEADHRPGPKGETVTICYTPSGKHERYPQGHRLYWHSKGYETTMRALDRLAARYPLRLEVVRHGQVSHAESLAMKRRAHIVIDECVTGSYHRNSLEGLAAGCVVVNGLGLLPEVEEVFRRCAPGSAASPFVRASLEELEAVLASLVERGAARLAEAGAANRRWMEEHWDFGRQWERFWAPVVARALGRAGRAPAPHHARNGDGPAPAPRHTPDDARAAVQSAAHTSVHASAHMSAHVSAHMSAHAEAHASANAEANAEAHAEAHAALRLVEPRATAGSREGVSVVVPHGGRERLPHLATTLERLRRVAGVLEVAVVEMDDAPHALPVARRLADAYAFVRSDGVFHKARVMNAGVPFAARGEVVLWLDNDLLLPEDFLPRALAEMHSRRLDCLVPWTSVRYLSREDTAEVFAARRGGVGDCRHVNAFYTRQGACGGAVLVRREFLERAGGMCEGFRGWGGEDNAWFYRARVLGHAAVTARDDQHLYHLHHENSGGYDATNHREKNPHYDENVALLQATRRVNDRAQMLARFPAPAHFTCPWETSRRVAFLFAGGDALASDAARATADALGRLYGLRVETVAVDDAAASGIEAAARLAAASDALVVFGEGPALRLLGDEGAAGARPKVVVAHVAAPASAFTDGGRELLRGAGGHFAFGAEAAAALGAAGLDCWLPVGGEDARGDATAAALGLAQPLSLAVAGAAAARAGERDRGAQLHTDGTTMNIDFSIPEPLPDMTVARESDLALPEFAAFNHGRDYPRMRRWELPFALHKARLAGTMSVLDCTINPLDFADRVRQLYPHVLYRHHSPAQGARFEPPVGFPDESFDRVVCVNTLEHLLAEQREQLLAEMARKLKPGGLLVVTSDFYFEDFRTRPELLRMGLVRADGGEVFNGFNRVTPAGLAEACARHGLAPLGGGAGGAPPESPSQSDATLYRNVEPYPHATVGAVFRKGDGAALLPPRRKVTLGLLTWNTRDISLESLGALVREAAMLGRLGHDASVVVCDNGSADGLREALAGLDGKLAVEHRFILNDENRGSSVARNQIIDHFLERGGDYLLFTDGDIEIVPHSSFAMLRHMEDSGRLLGCVGAAMYGQSPLRQQATPHLYALAGMQLDADTLLAWTQYGLFRREVFESGVRFDTATPFDREGWGCEDNDLAFQMTVGGFRIQRFCGMTYLHRAINSSVRVLRALGVDPAANYEERRRYVVAKWEGTPAISGPLKQLRDYRMRFSA
ncbi:MAG TPA: glycosyltransferase [Pyrinomonadaceae bacterium]|jgi:GT2 family glycosyltransferase